MDSLTQAVLGATVGEAVLGKKVGNKAPLWGAVAGTIPDLDVVLNYFVGEVQSTLWHRTFSHSLFVLTLAAPLFGYLVYHIYRRRSSATFSDWTLLFFWGLITHPLLDGCTNYGTMLLYPFSMERISWRTIFIIDPLYTLPLLIATIAVLFMKKGSLKRRRTAIIGLGISSVYLATTFFIKAHVSKVVEASLKDQNIPYQKFMTTPTFFNTILWSTVVKSEAGYHVGYYSLLDDDRQIDFKYLPQNEALLLLYLQAASPEKEEQIRDLIDFTERFYAMEEAEQGIYLNDLRFGIMTGWFDLSEDFIFSFHIFKEAGAVRVERADSAVNPNGEDFNRLLQRTLGK
ncbi:MAG: metal-dependent hydrolase [Cyclobacteriaceae bacterium]